MKLTPLEVKRQQFKKVLRGYDPVEVETFLEMIANEIEEYIKAAKEYQDRLIESEVQLRDYKNMEKTLQQTLMQAQEASGKSIENSRKEAQLIVHEAELKAQQILDKARQDFAHIRDEISGLRTRKQNIMSRLKVLLSSEIDLLKALDVEDEVLQRDPSLGTGKDHLEVDEILKKL
ncbi:MAG: DivIVA domain-containing protein [Ignavibacteriae bacterium]|nr:DivIVA domain-containing protein [Ignavibacteriota bacterium]